MKWMFLPLKRYADFDGRSPRIEYWMFQLFTWIVIGALLAITFALAPPPDLSSDPSVDSATPDFNPMFGLPLVIIFIFYLAILIPSIAVTVRRLHDRDMSGWFYLINFVPYVGGFIIFIFMVLPGTEGENSYGENPLDEDGNRPDQLEEIFT